VAGKVLLFVLAGVLVGGTWSLYKQGVPKIVTILVGLFASAALVAAVLWQF
jgi:hypothetical protein